MTLVEIEVNEVAGEATAQVFFENGGQEWEMSVKGSSKADAEAKAQAQAAAYLAEWAADPNAANAKYGVYMF